MEDGCDAQLSLPVSDDGYPEALVSYTDAPIRELSTGHGDFVVAAHRASSARDGYGGFVCEIDLPLLDWCVFPVEFEA